MKKRLLLFLLPILSISAGILLLVWTGTKHPDLSEQEKLAMEKLPGYFFVFEGKQTTSCVRSLTMPSWSNIP